MVYNQKLVCVIKAQNKIIREFDNKVKLPFGIEYSILIKNLNTVKAKVSISIDGTDIADGQKFIIGPNSDFEVERYLKNNNLSSGNKFKFIEMNESIEKTRGAKIDDGIIRVEYEFEQQVQYIPNIVHPIVTYPIQPIYQRPPYWYSTTDSMNQMNSVSNATNSIQTKNKKFHYNTLSYTHDCAEPGITVPGGISHQEFKIGQDFITDGAKYSIILNIIGYHQKEDDKQLITVKTKQKCVTCHKVNKSHAKFCSNCGTGLIIL